MNETYKHGTHIQDHNSNWWLDMFIVYNLVPVY